MKRWQIFSFFGITFMIIGWTDLIDFISFKKQSNLIKGEIVQEEYYWQEAGRESSHYNYKFELDSIKFQGYSRNLPVFLNLYKVGDKVDILYSKKNPSVNRINDFTSTYFIFSFSSLLSALFFLISYRVTKRKK